MEELKELLSIMSWDDVKNDQDTIVSAFMMLYPKEAEQLDYPLTEAGYKYIQSIVCTSDEPEEPSEDTYYSSAAEYAEQIAQAQEELAVAEEQAIKENIKEEKIMAKDINVNVNEREAKEAQGTVNKINSVDWNTIVKAISEKSVTFRKFIKGLAGNSEEEFVENLNKNKDKLFKEMKEGLNRTISMTEKDADSDVPGAEEELKKLSLEREKFSDIIHDDDKLFKKIGRLLKSFLLLLARLFMQAIKLAFKIVKPLIVSTLIIVVIAVNAVLSVGVETYNEIIKPAYSAGKKAVADFKGKRAAAKVGVDQFLDDEHSDDEDSDDKEFFDNKVYYDDEDFLDYED